jgi:secondary thiamine-phosphate synthase enzyme
MSGAATRQALGRLTIETPGPGFTDRTAEVARFVAESGIRDGLLTAFCRHADPDVRADLMTALDRLAPRDAPYMHGVEGPDDMPAHIRTMLTGPSVSIPVGGGELALGTWQGLYLIEHRDRPHRREIVLHYLGTLGG